MVNIKEIIAGRQVVPYILLLSPNRSKQRHRRPQHKIVFYVKVQLYVKLLVPDVLVQILQSLLSLLVLLVSALLNQ